MLAGNRPSPDSFEGIERVLGELVAAAGMTPGEAQQTLFAIGAYVIGSATEWQAEADRAAVLIEHAGVHRKSDKVGARGEVCFEIGEGAHWRLVAGGGKELDVATAGVADREAIAFEQLLRAGP